MEFIRKTGDVLAGFLDSVATLFASQLDDILFSSVALIFGFLNLFPELLKRTWALLFLIGLGLLLVYARKRFISSADGFAVIVPALLEGVNLMIKSLNGLVGVFGSMGTAISNLSQGRSVVDSNYGSLFSKIPEINTERVASWIREVPAQCAPYTSATSVLDGIIRDSASPAVCPAMRRLYVVDWLYPWVYPIVDFFALSYDPTPPFTGSENNCRASGAVPRWECLIIGLGYVVLEMILPLLLVSIAYTAFGRETLDFLAAILFFIVALGYESVLAATGVVESFLA